jgi:hypothetical protein
LLWNLKNIFRNFFEPQFEKASMSAVVLSKSFWLWLGFTLELTSTSSYYKRRDG